MFRALEYALREDDQDAVKARGLKIADKGFALIDKSLAGKD